MGNKMFLPAKSDIIFRLFFADERNAEFLVGFLKSVLKLPEDDYDRIKKIISIIITDEEMISGSARYHHRFTLYDREAQKEFKVLIEIHTLELGKLPQDTDGTILYDWARFIAAESEEELKMVVERNPQVGRAVVKLVELSADERARDLYERREKARRDENMRTRVIKFEIAKKLLEMDLSVEQIVNGTGLTAEEVENLRTT